MAEEVAKNKNGTDMPKLEANEEDPCIEFKAKSRQRKFIEDTERRLRERSGLSRLGLYIVAALLLALLVFFVVIITMAACWPRQAHHQKFPVCKKPECLRAAAKVQEAMNATLSPCQDLWGWACGGWLSKNLLPSDRSEWSIWEQHDVEEAARVRNLVTTLPLPVHTLTTEWKLKHLYEACTDVDNVIADNARPLTTIISELGGWAILRDWNIQDFDENFILKQLHVKYGASPYFRVSVEPNPRLPGRNAITLHPAGLGLPDKSYYYTRQDDPIQIAYRQMIRDVVLFLAVTEVQAQQFGDDIFYYEKRIAEISPSSYDLQNPVSTYNIVKLSELRITAPSLPLFDILTAMFPEANISEDTEVIVVSLNYLADISRIVASTDRAMLDNYVMWTLVKKYLPYLSSKFTSTVDAFKAKLLGVQHPIQRWEKCAKLSRNFMGLAIEHAFETQNPLSQTTKTTVRNIFQQIKKTLKERLKKYHISSDLQRYLQNKLTKLNIQIGLPEITQKENFVKEHYRPLAILKVNLFESYKNCLVFRRKIEQQLLIAPHPQHTILLKAESSSKVVYIPSENTVLVPRVALSQFEDAQPSSMLYGRLGLKIAEAVVESVFPFESSWNADLRLLTPFHHTVNESQEAVQRARRCLMNFVLKYELATEDVANLTSLRTLKHISAVNLAHEALVSSLKDTEHVHQPSLEKYEDSAVFFLTYAQGQCSQITRQKELYNNQVNFELSRQKQLQVTWSQIPDFPSSLECAPENDCSDLL